MKAIAAFPASKEVRVVRHPEPRLTGPGSVLVRTLEVGVCGTDAELCAFHFGYPPGGDEYLVLGHEAVGRVEEIGTEVSTVAPGDLVVPSVRRPCPDARCPACRLGAQDYCVTGRYTERGIFGAHGFLAERFGEEEKFLYRVPAELRASAVLVEPLTIAEKGLRQYAAIQRRLPWLRDADDLEILRGRRGLVLGAGPVGLLAAMLLRSRGCDVTVYSLEEASSRPAGIVEDIGGEYRSARTMDVPALAEEIGDIELVYEAAGAPALTLSVLGRLGRNGVFILTGATGGGGHLDFGAADVLNRMVNGNVVLAGTVNASRVDFIAAVADLAGFDAAWPEALRGIITGRHPMEEFPERALDRSGIKDIIDLTLSE